MRRPIYKHGSLNNGEERPASIREMFDRDFKELGVDCFSLFVEDAWSKGVLIPQEIDTHLYYPELTFSAPNLAFYRDSVASLCKLDPRRGVVLAGNAPESGTYGTLVYGAFSEAGEGPASPQAAVLQQFDHLGPLCRTFLAREEIKSAVVFLRVPENGLSGLENVLKQDGSIAAGIDCLYDLLFFNFRTSLSAVRERTMAPRPEDSVDGNNPAVIRAHTTRLAHLAHRILDYLPTIESIHSKRALPSAKRAVTAFTGILNAVDRHGSASATSEDQARLFNDLATSLQSSLLNDREAETERAINRFSNRGGRSAPSDLIVSIYLLEQRKNRTVPEPFHSPTAVDPEILSPTDQGCLFLELKGSSLEKEARRSEELSRISPTQWFLHKDKPVSITVLTALMRSAHVLQRVDRFVPRGDKPYNLTLETSIPLTTEQMRVATEEDRWPLIAESDAARAVICESDGSRRPRFVGEIQTLQPSGQATSDVIEYAFCVLRSDEPPPPGGSEYRLLVQHPVGLSPVKPPDPAHPLVEAVRLKLAESQLGKQWPVLVDKIYRRMRFQHAHVFGQLDQAWDGPSSEICVPIRVSGRCLGCINIESRTINRFNPSSLGILSALARIIESRYPLLLASNIDDLGRQVLDKLHNATSQEEPVKSADDDGLASSEGKFGFNRYIRAVAEYCQAERAFVATTPMHQDGYVRFLAVSEPAWYEKAGWPLPRSDGWTMRLCKETIPDEIAKHFAPHSPSAPGHHGVVLFPEGKVNGRAAWWIVEKDKQYELVEVAHAPIVNVAKYGLERTHMLVGLPIISSQCAHPPPYGRAVLWLVYPHAILPFPSRKDPATERRRKAMHHALRHLIGTATKTREVIDKWSSQRVVAYELLQDKDHGRPPTLSLGLVDEAMEITNDKERVSVRQESLRRHEYRIIESEIALLVGRGGQQTAESARRLLAQLGDPAFGVAFSKLELQLDEFFNLSAVSGLLRHGLSENVTLRFDEDIERFTLAREGHPWAVAKCLLFLLKQICLNVNALSKESDAKPITVTVKAGIVSADRPMGSSSGQLLHRKNDLLIEVFNDGPPVPEDMIPTTTAFCKRLPLLYGQKRGRGLDLMARVARLLNVHVPDRHALLLENCQDPSGVRYAFTVAADHFRHTVLGPPRSPSTRTPAP